MKVELRIDDQPVYVNESTTPPAPSSDSGLIWPRDQSELRAVLQAALDDAYVVHLHPQTAIEISETIELVIRSASGFTFGASGNHASLRWVGTTPGDMIRLVSDVDCRNFVFERFYLYGGLYDGRPSGAGLRFVAPKGKSVRLAILRDLFVEWTGGEGIAIEGDFFESVIDNVHAENCDDGLVLANGADGGIVSNMMVRSPNLSRNRGYGLLLDQRCGSVDVQQGSFIVNAKGGIFAPAGIRTVDSVNFENTGEVGIDVPECDWGTRIVGCSASSDGATMGLNGTPMRYLFRYHGDDAKLQVLHNTVAYYGGDPAFQMAVRAP